MTPGVSPHREAQPQTVDEEVDLPTVQFDADPPLLPLDAVNIPFPEDHDVLRAVEADVHALTAKFPLYADLLRRLT